MAAPVLWIQWFSHTRLHLRPVRVNMGKCLRLQIALNSIQPKGLGHTAKPGELPLCIISGSLFELVHTGLQRAFFAEIRKEFLIADGLSSCMLGIPMIIDQPGLLQNSLLQHQIHPAVNPLIQNASVLKADAKQQTVVGWLARF